MIYSDDPSRDALQYETQRELEQDLFDALCVQKFKEPAYNPFTMEALDEAMAFATIEQDKAIEKAMQDFWKTGATKEAYALASAIVNLTVEWKERIIRDVVTKEMENSRGSVQREFDQ